MPHLAASGRPVAVRAPASPAPVYARHTPERTLLYALVQAHYPDFLERQAAHDHPVPDYVRAEIDRPRSEHGRVVLWEGHSIRSVVPYLFDGRLPDFNLGTASGSSCSPVLQQRLEAVLAAQRDYTWVANGRFKGGYITRHFGRPQDGVHAVQMELAQCNYMDEDSFEYVEAVAAPTQAVIRRLLETAIEES